MRVKFYDNPLLPLKSGRMNEVASTAEILGRIGMIPVKDKGERFKLTHLNTREFLRRVNEIVEGDNDTTLSIPCAKDEFEQFDIN